MKKKMPMLKSPMLMHEFFFEQVDPRRWPELRDSHEVNEDKSAVANLSPRAIHKEWQKVGRMNEYESEIG